MDNIKNPLAYIKPSNWGKALVAILAASTTKVAARPFDAFVPRTAAAGATGLNSFVGMPSLAAPKCTTYAPIYREVVQVAYWELDFALRFPLRDPAGAPPLSAPIKQKLALHIEALNTIDKCSEGACDSRDSWAKFSAIADQALVDVGRDPACAQVSDAKTLLIPYFDANLSSRAQNITTQLLEEYFRPADAHEEFCAAY